ncbi:MAG TPA: TonB-dependent receptor [Candidatus Acidoferrum sp.]|nr:TonB-dependent receptor [Candidatus Acidoferrum sp.]
MTKRFVLGCLIALSLVLGFSVPNAAGQAVFGNIIGTVTDTQGAAVAGAKVKVTSTTKSTSFDTTSNDDGNYSVTHLIPDTYKIHIEATGFKSYDVPSVVVQADSSAHVDAALQVGAVTQTVEVTGEIPQLKTDRADVDIEFNQTYVSELPVLNRNFTNFELLSPGTQKLVGWSHAATENPQGGGQIFVNGQHFSGTNFELDGTDNQDPILGIIVVNPNLDAIGETKIALQDYDAESGKATAGAVKVQTKSGTNDFHGSGFYFYRNSEQQARDPFANAPGVPLAAATWKQFGGSVGGPIIKNKLFFFGDYQGTRQVQGITNQYTLPDAKVLATCGNNLPGNCDLSDYLAISGGQVFDPTTGNKQTGVGRTAFSGNLIPNSMISPQATLILQDLKKLTLTNTNLSNNYIVQGSGPFEQKSFDTRIDYSAPHNYQVFGRFSLDYFSLSGKGGLGVLGGTGFGPGGLNGSSINHDYSLATGFTKPIGQKWLTDFRFGWFKYNPQTAYSDASFAGANNYQIPGLNISGHNDTLGTPSFYLDGNGSFSAMGDGLNIGRCNCPLTESEQQVQFVNNWTRTQGNHTIKFGADIRYAKNLRVPSDNNRAGELHFDSGVTSNAGTGGLSLATFLLGDVSNFFRYSSVTLDAAERQKRWFFYGQDTWRLTPKFTLTYGLRWEIYFPESVNGKGNGGFANQDQGVIRVAGYGGIGNDGNISNTLKAFAPRLSAAYQIDSKTVLRIGYGRGFDIGVFGSNFGHVVTQNLPVLAKQNLNDSNCGTLQPTCGPGATANRSAAFTLSQGPSPSIVYSGAVIGDISSSGTLPLFGPDGASSPNIRPTVQRLPTIDQWNASVQRQITPTINLTVAYVGNKGTHVFAGNGPSYNSNEASVVTGTDIVSCFQADGVTPKNPCTVSFSPAVPFNNRRPLFRNGVGSFSYPGFLDASGNPLICCSSDTNYYGNDANNNYNSLQIKAEKRVSQGLQFIAHYTFSHANFYDAGYYSVNKKYAYGPDDFNRTHAFVVNTVYELPIGKGKRFMSDTGRVADLLIGGWQLTNTLNYSGGLPWTPSINECGAISDAGPCRPNLVSGQSFSVGKHTMANGDVYWFTPVTPLAYPVDLSNAAGNNPLNGTDLCTMARPTSGAFSLPACGQIGNVGRNSFRGPRGFYSDMALAKTFNITERYKAQFRFDAYNVFNHPVLAFSSTQGNTCVDCTGRDPGRITDIENDNSPGSPSGMRQLQFGVRFTF